MITALTTDQIISTAVVVATLISVVLGALVAQYIGGKSRDRSQKLQGEQSTQKMMARLIRTLEGETEEDGFTKSTGFIEKTNNRLDEHGRRLKKLEGFGQ